MQVPLLDLKIQYRALKNEIEPKIKDICDRQYFILGPDVASFEEKTAEYCGTAYAVGCASGSDAIVLALMALDVKRDVEVLTTPYTFFATAGAIARICAVPVFLDIDPVTYNLDPKKLRAFLTETAEKRDDGVYSKKTGRRIGAILPVHLYGQTADMEQILSIAEEYGIPVIEDAAQSIGAMDGKLKKKAGNMGKIGCFSFFPSKNLGAFGDGGALSTNDSTIANRLKSLRMHGESTRYHHNEVGFNSRLDALQAAVLEIKLKYLDGWTAGRQKNAAYYNKAFEKAGCDGILATPKAVNGNHHIYNQYILRVKDRDKLVDYLRENNIGCAIYYPVPLHLQKCFEYLGYREGRFPEAEKAANETIALPIYSELTTEQKDAVIQAILNFYR
ncbi:MAG: transcriptional regulator [Acidobacteria bacterium]|nr:MAG: transcriptional regulator [Acidobacteriota bacterium]RLE20436.1 MAG: transcriptional regulator [Acidobacteriota bacterium]